MLLKWISKTLKARAAAREDAAALIRDHGKGALPLARERAREARVGQIIDADRDARHWDRVRALIARQLKVSKVDTATRILDDRR